MAGRGWAPGGGIAPGGIPPGPGAGAAETTIFSSSASFTVTLASSRSFFT